jgi:D-amino-acid oxidase
MSNLDDAGEFLERMPCYEFGLKGIIEYGFSVVTLDALDFSAFELIDLRRLVAGCDMAVRFECVLCNSTVYLDWLVQRLRTRGVVFRSGTVVDPDDIPWKHHNVVFNCMGYQTVFPDDELYPVLGQSMFVPTEEPVVPAFGIGAGDHAVFAQRRGFHIGAHFIRGVTAGTPRQDLYKSSLDFVTGSYLALCDSVGLSAPAIDLGAVSRVNVGVRPFRPSGPRVERDRAFAALIHNYGHGAHGWTTGYGSALEAVRLAGLL